MVQRRGGHRRKPALPHAADCALCHVWRVGVADAGVHAAGLAAGHGCIPRVWSCAGRHAVGTVAPAVRRRHYGLELLAPPPRSAAAAPQHRSRCRCDESERCHAYDSPDPARSAAAATAGRCTTAGIAAGTCQLRARGVGPLALQAHGPNCSGQGAPIISQLLWCQATSGQHKRGGQAQGSP